MIPEKASKSAKSAIKIDLTGHQKTILSGKWQKLEELAAVLLSLGVRTTPGQVASALLHQSLEQLETLDPKSLAEQLKS